VSYDSAELLPLGTELTLPSVLKLRGYKFVTTAFVAAILFLLSLPPAFASDPPSRRHFSYRTQLSQDLDGDHKPETATVKQVGLVYKVSIHFTSGRPKVQLTTPITPDSAGLTVHTTDVNNDNRGDLILLSATSVRPVAVWVNQGRARFKKVAASFLAGAHKYTGPAYKAERKGQPQPAGNLLIDPLPQATIAPEYVTVNSEAGRLHSYSANVRLFDSLLRQEPPRGPPDFRNF
jgi:hypothetical protein